MPSTSTSDDAVTCRLSAGVVVGVRGDRTNRFLGIPYAAAPFGVHRLAAPAAAAWSGEWDATRPGPSCPQHAVGAPFAAVLPAPNADEADALHVNVWAPHAVPPGGAPVLVWFHGGGLVQGSNAQPVLDGRAFAERGLVVVVPNYRVGMEGFAVLDGAPTNRGLLDQLAALRWVQEEVAAFGGDPGRVTVAGHSAGGASVAALLSSPAAAGLFSRAIIQSGPLDAAPATEPDALTLLVADALEIPATREAFAQCPAVVLVAQVARLLGEAPAGANKLGCRLVLDRALLPSEPGLALQQGAADGVPLLMGVTSEEYRLWADPSVLDLVDEAMVHAMAGSMGASSSLVAAYRRALPDLSWGELLGTLHGDLALRAPMLAVAEARRQRGVGTHVYEFAYRSPRWGAAHSVELPFVFNTLNTDEGRLLAGDDAPASLAELMNSAWADFVGTGSPGWPEWAGDGCTQVFDDQGSRMTRSPVAAAQADLLDIVAARRLAPSCT